MSKKIKLSSITPDDKNNNKHTAYGMDLLEKSVNKVGIIESITVSNDDKIISGNARHEIIGKNFTKEALVIETDGTQPIIIKRTDIESDTKQFYEASILANTTSKKNIDFDMEVIDSLAVEYDIDVVDLGVDIVNEEILEAEEDDFDTTPPEDPITVLSDLYEIGDHRLLCGDSTDSDSVAKLMNGCKFDILVTSPPYNQGNGSGDLLTNGKKEVRLYDDKNADNKSKQEYYDFLISILNTAFIFKNDIHSICWNVSYNAKSRDDYGKIIFSKDNPFNVHETIIWDKGHSINLPQIGIYSRRCEFVFIMSDYDKYLTSQTYNDCRWNIWSISSNKSQTTGEQTEHRAAYPIEFASKMITDFSFIDNLIYEPFLGSGSTMVAGHQLKRKVYGMELDPKYCDVIVARMIKLDSTLSVKRNGVLLTNSEVLKFTENTSESK